MTTKAFNRTRSELRHDQSVSRCFTTPTRKDIAILLTAFSLILLIPLSAPGEGTTHPKFLVPVNPNDRAYEQAIESLLHGRQGRGTMIYTESTYAGNDFVISAWGKDRSERDVDHPL